MKTLKTVYETTDGKMWKDKGQAKRHEAWIELVALSGDILPKTQGDYENEDDRAKDMADALLFASVRLRRVLRADPIDGGGEPDPPKANGEAPDEKTPRRRGLGPGSSPPLAKGSER